MLETIIETLILITSILLFGALIWADALKDHEACKPIEQKESNKWTSN